MELLSRSLRWRRGAGWLLTAAALLTLYVPLVPPFLLSLAPGGAENAGFSLHAYAEIWRNPILVDAILVSAQVGMAVAAVATILGLLAAMAVRELKVPRLVLAIMLLPLFIPGVSMGLATAFFFRQLGIAPSLLTIAAVQVLWALPFATVVILTVMASFDPIYVEAAYVSGAGRFRAFRDIELPLILPGIGGAATFSLILSFNETIRTAAVQGPYNTVQTYIWSTYRQVGLSPPLYALMSLMIVLTIVLVVVFLRAERKPARAAPAAINPPAQ